MANGRAAGAARRDPTSSTTRESAINTWGKVIANQISKGDSIYQKSHTLLPPRTLPQADPARSRSGPVTAPLRFHGTNAIILRTVAVKRGYQDPTFALERTARAFNKQHGDEVKPVQNSAKQVELPTGARNADETAKQWRDAKLAKDGPNFDAFGAKVDGKAGDQQRDDKGQKVRELVEVQGVRRAAGVRTYYHRDDLNLPHLQPRQLPTERARDAVLSTTVGRLRNTQNLGVEETPDMAGRAALVMQPKGTTVGDEKLKEDRYTIKVGPEDSFPSKDHHRAAIVHEVSRFSMCRDGDKDALAVAKADPDPAQREKMPEFGRSELPAMAATMEKVTAAGMEWHPPTYQREHVRDIRKAQTDMLREPGGLDKLGTQAHRVERLNDGRQATAFEQRARNEERRQAAPQVEQAARGFATRSSRPMARAQTAGTSTPEAPGTPDNAPAKRGTGRARPRAAAAAPGKVGAQAKEPAAAPSPASGASKAKTGQARGAQSKADDAKPPR
jgi:hypothetical protein